MVFSRSARMRVQLIAFRYGSVLMKTLVSSTTAFSGLRSTESRLCCRSDSARSCALIRLTSCRRSASCVRSVRASEISPASVPTSSRLTATEATNMARLRRNGWLARLIGILISIILRNGPQIPQQPRVILPWSAERRVQRLHRHAQLLLEPALALDRPRAETAQDQAVRTPVHAVFRVHERGNQHCRHIVQFR